jgi:hypothetical protein
VAGTAHSGSAGNSRLHGLIVLVWLRKSLAVT